MIGISLHTKCLKVLERGGGGGGGRGFKLRD